MKHLLFFTFLIVIIGCSETEARRPVKVKTGNILQQSVERNKNLLAIEEAMMQKIIAQDSLNTYFSSGGGSWYYYVNKNDQADYFPQTDDLVSLQYNLVSFENDTIYTQQDIGIITYKVDKQELFPGLRTAVKLLKENETATFLIPSSLGYGYHGDNDQIGINIPLKATVSILKIDKQSTNIQN
ncbi:gliding motility-associated peptidyl-prolyl isomerase GldI [Arenibacter sp. 6A1]|uniref:gliding motility-associated peptidyl-prolyl isomerase GldI n=1 Tax=Arenibacter sp. 6A1 TaxID=2720391 RepID=UPI0014475769|nr:gliding motility-associated peptidyl-prolyl isomerase GldI [Arenibacter sp. 6A1]NKI27701.1 gliding motility-associated peptidyl-prolyl isomerase GldI [Arenibacter sp. 6A1]